MRFIVPGIPHTITHPDYSACAFTQKVLKFCAMMTQRGHEVIHLGHPDSEVECSRHFDVTDHAVLAQAYGSHDWRRHQFRFDIGDSAYQEFNRRASQVLRKIALPGDFLVCPFGQGHLALSQTATQLGCCVTEPGIGYTQGHIPGSWRVYESHTVRTLVEGARNPQNWYSWVIPNYFDVRDFEYSAQKQPWILYLGRVSEAKGITTCIQAAAAAGVQLRIAGQGRLSDLGYTTTPAHVQELGYAAPDLRRALLRDASALIVASNYSEPFGGVQVEAMLSGTPIITPFHGAFAEINQPRVTGFQCRTLRDFRDAIQNRHQITSENCRQAGQAYTYPVVAPQFEAWFRALQELWTGQGWTAL